MTIRVLLASIFHLCRFLVLWGSHHVSHVPVKAVFIDQCTSVFLQKMEFLQMFDLTTLARREEMMEVKRRKRRRMLRERSPSPPAIQSKRPSPAPLITRFTPEDMNKSPELEDKKRFLTIFSLNHITQQQRRGTHAVYHVHTDAVCLFYISLEMFTLEFTSESYNTIWSKMVKVSMWTMCEEALLSPQSFRQQTNTKMLSQAVPLMSVCLFLFSFLCFR